MALVEFSLILCDVIMMTYIQSLSYHFYQDEFALFISCQPKTIGIILKCAVKVNRQLRSSSARRSLDRCNQLFELEDVFSVVYSIVFDQSCAMKS